MLIFIDIFIVIFLSAAVMVINYLIFACSKISPCYIEFDDRKKSEMKLMREYNEGFKKVFLMYIFTCVIISLLLLASFVGFVAMVLMAVQLMYTVGASLVMLWMYVRSFLYWEREFKKQEEKRKASLVGNALNILIY